MREKAVHMMCAFLFLTVFSSPGFANGRHEDVKKQPEKTDMKEKNVIAWEKSRSDKGMTIIPGSLPADFGRFNFEWRVGADGKARLVTLEPAGSAESPMIEKKLLPMLLENGTSRLFLEWFPLANAKEPVSVRLIAVVSTDALFSVLSAKNLPPVSPAVKETAIWWGDITSRKGTEYLAGSCTVSFGTLNIYWKKSGGRSPELITLESPGAGELPPMESPLTLWRDEESGITTICQVRFPQLNQGFTPHLWPLANVKTDELMSGLKRLDR